MRYKSKLKRAFTLLEIMIVIVIIWILMWATMRFGWDRIGFLNNKNIKEQFISNYDTLYSNNMTTNYYMWNLYTDLEIAFILWYTWFDYIYKWYGADNIFSGTTRVDGGIYEIINISIDWEEMEDVTISLVPYILGCNINWWQNQLAEIEIFVNNAKNYCFEINSDNCRMYSVSCD
jgi:prepilin-type N-terminal cleavage/methylation domain-containing protein